MFEIAMLTGFLAAAISQLLPEYPQKRKPGHRAAKDFRSGQPVRKNSQKAERSQRTGTSQKSNSAGGKPGEIIVRETHAGSRLEFSSV